MNEDHAVLALSALAHTQRLRVFRALVVAGDSGLTPGSLSTQLDLAPSALSFHLKALLGAELVSSEPNGRHLIYRARYAQMNALIGYLGDNCCSGSRCELQTSEQDTCC